MTKRITSGQEKQIVRFGSDAVEAALKGVVLDQDGAQLVIEKGDEFGQIVGDAVRRALACLSVREELADEEVASTYAYPPEYTGPAPISEQVDRLAALFGLSIGGTQAVLETLPSRMLPDGAEGWFAIPSVDALAARFFPEVQDSAERYCYAVVLICQKLGELRRFCNYREGQLSPDRLRQQPHTAVILERIASEQKGDILVIPAQFGLRYRGKSIRRARAIFRKVEFGLGALQVGSMILTHPTRFVRWEQLHTDCPGDKYAPGAGGKFVLAPCFYFFGGRLGFGCGRVGYYGGDFGSASAFLPQ